MRRNTARSLAVAGALLLLGAALLLPAPAFVVGPGPALAAHELVEVPGSGAGPSPLLVTTIDVRPATVGAAMAAALSPSREVWPRGRLVGPGESFEDLGRRARGELERSQRAARAAAEAYLGREVEVRFAAAPVGGPSAGLALALEVIRQVDPRLTPPVTVAVTGILKPGGEVERVGGVALKVRAAERAGARVMIVPAADVELARRAASGLDVVGVEDLAGAVRALLTVAARRPYNATRLEGVR